MLRTGKQRRATGVKGGKNQSFVPGWVKMPSPMTGKTAPELRSCRSPMLTKCNDTVGRIFTHGDQLVLAHVSRVKPMPVQASDADPFCRMITAVIYLDHLKEQTHGRSQETPSPERSMRSLSTCPIPPSSSISDWSGSQRNNRLERCP